MTGERRPKCGRRSRRASLAVGLFAGFGFAIAPASAQDASDADTRGRALYENHCLVCHQADGGGVPNFQPSIIDSPWLTGRAHPIQLSQLTLYGLDTNDWDNVMAGVAHLSDADIAALLNYARRTFTTPSEGADAPLAITPEIVAVARDEGPLPSAPSRQD